jgi:DNA-binding NarL/FixJ family response regulator
MTALNAQGHGLVVEFEVRAPDSANTSWPDRTRQTNATQPSVRLTAIGLDSNVTSATSLLPLWRDLTQGRSRVADGFFTSERCYLLLAPHSGQARPLEARRLAILEAVLRGAPQKCIAIDHRLAPSTIALHAKLALENLGIMDRPSRTHPLMMRIARSASKAGEARCSNLYVDADREFRIVSMPRPEQTLSSVLPSAEFEVIQSLVEGLSYQDIAERRDTSARTVANQISAVFRRLQVSGRNALVERLFLDQESRQPRKRATEQASQSDTSRSPSARSRPDVAQNVGSAFSGSTPKAMCMASIGSAVSVRPNGNTSDQRRLKADPCKRR